MPRAAISIKAHGSGGGKSDILPQIRNAYGVIQMRYHRRSAVSKKRLSHNSHLVPELELFKAPASLDHRFAIALL